GIAGFSDGAAGSCTLTTTVLDAPPPGGGFTTVNCTVPTSATSSSSSTTRISLGDTYVMTRGTGSVVWRSGRVTAVTELSTKPCPWIVSVTAAEPAGTRVGSTPMMRGRGLLALSLRSSS